MRILLVNKYFNMHGGSETYFFGLAELLQKAGHEVIFFAMQDEKNLACKQSEYFVSNVEFNGNLTLTQKIKAALHRYFFSCSTEIESALQCSIVTNIVGSTVTSACWPVKSYTISAPRFSLTERYRN